MLTGFFDLDFTDAESVQSLIGNLGYGMSTALTTTLVGLVCSLTLTVSSRAAVRVRLYSSRVWLGSNYTLTVPKTGPG